MQLVPRPYQLEAAEEALARNVIVVLPTGSGKTLVAILVAERLLGQAENRGKVVIVVVSSTAVLAQQAEHFRRDSDLRVAVLSGGVHIGQARVGGAQVLVGTAEVFRRALMPGVQTGVQGQFRVAAPELPLAEVCLAVFDEAHHAIKAHPYAELARLLCISSGSTTCQVDGSSGTLGTGIAHAHPKILGLTASFLHGQLKNVDGKRHMLEDTLHSQLFLPACHELPADANRHFFKVIVSRTEGSRQRVSPADIGTITGDILRPLMCEIGLEFEAAALLLKEADSGVFIVYDILGVGGWASFLQEALFEIVETKLFHKARHVSDAAKLQIQMSVQKLRCLRPRVAEVVASHYHPGMNEALSPRADALLKILESECCLGRACGVHAEPSPLGDSRALDRVIVFVERAALCWPLAATIRNRFAVPGELAAMESGRLEAEAVAVPVAGVQVMLEGPRSGRLAAFRDGRACCAVATASLEEGLDVADCRYVVRFDCFHNVRSHIQGAGRARHPEARVFYFENEPEVEEARAAYVHSVTQGDASAAEFGNEAGVGQTPAERLVYSPGMTGPLSVPEPFDSQGGCEATGIATSQAFCSSLEEIGGGHRWGLEETTWDVVANASIRAQRCTSCPAVARITSRKYGRGRKKTERLFSLHQGPSECCRSASSMAT
mmetsp:Transcript_25455/g.73015  ORF Transcript_25455/g.73015 Transcript_25455/m.73015 type:complete len:665 (+) Transcript_25455:135-2129(+)